MLPIGDRPMLEHIMAWLASQENQVSPLIDQAIFSMGYQPDSIINAYPNNICADLPFVCAVEPEPLGTAGALRYAASQCEVSRTFLAMNGDIFTQISCADLVDQHRRSGAEATLALTAVSDPSQFGVVITGDDGRVKNFLEKPPKGEKLGNPPSSWINAGIYVMEPSVLARIPEGRPVSLEREIFPQLALENSLFAFQSEAVWLDVGTPESYRQAQILSVSSNPETSNPPEARIHPSATVATDSKVTGSMVMANVRIDEGAVVEDSVLLPSSWVEAEAVVRSSILGEGAVVKAGAVVEEVSVIADNATVEAGSHLRAARH